MRLAGLTLLAFLSLTPAAQAQPSPSFTAFLKFCADPHMTAQSVRKAVENADGKALLPETKLSLFGGVASTWNATVQGHKFRVDILDGHVPTGPNTVQEFVSCALIDDGGDDRASQAALKQWAEVAPDISGIPGVQTVTYHFEWNGQKRIPVPNGDAARDDEEAGKVWRLIVSSMSKFTRIRLEHSLKTTPKQ